MPRIFISYRRAASAGQAGRLYDRLGKAFGRENVFMDIDKIPAGETFESYILREIERCDVFLAMLSEGTLGTGERKRIFEPDDWVRREIAYALSLPHVRVIPVLIDGFRMPKPDDLPEDLQRLSSHNSVFLLHELFEETSGNIVRRIKQAVEQGRPRRSLWPLAVGLLAVIGIVAVGAAYLASQQPQLTLTLTDSSPTSTAVVNTPLPSSDTLEPPSPLPNTATDTPTDSPTEMPLVPTAEPSTLASTLVYTPAPFGGGQGEIAFISDRDRTDELYLMNADGSNIRPLTDENTDIFSFAWSPDGEQIALVFDYDGAEVFVMNADGTNLRPITENSVGVSGANWSPDGAKIIFTQLGDNSTEIYVMNADGTNAQPLTESDDIENWPVWSPDGRRIAFSAGQDGLQIYVMNADGTGIEPLTSNPDGATIFDLFPRWSPDGTQLIFGSNRENEEGNIFMVNANGSNLHSLPNSEGYYNPSWSPDGTQIVFNSEHDGNREIYAMSTDGTNVRRLTNDPANDIAPAWRP